MEGENARRQPMVLARRERARTALEEECVERDGLGERHADDGLYENFGGGTRIAAHGFGGLEADKPYSDGGAEAAETALNAASDFSECVDHDGICVSLVGLPPSAQSARSRREMDSGGSVGGFFRPGVFLIIVMIIAVVADQADVNAD